MEQIKLTIRLPRGLLEDAKRYAYDHHTTLTRLVAGYLRQLQSKDDPLAGAPVVRRLSGILQQEASVEEYHLHLEEKYGRQA